VTPTNAQFIHTNTVLYRCYMYRRHLRSRQRACTYQTCIC